MAYGERIKFYRVLRQMSQEELSEQTGITYTSISRIEHGTRKVTLEEAVRFADILHISLEDLAGIPAFAEQQQEVKTLFHQYAQKVREAETALHAANSIEDNLERSLFSS